MDWILLLTDIYKYMKQIINELRAYQSTCPNCETKLSLSEVELFEDKNFGEKSLEYYEAELKKVQKQKERLDGMVGSNFDWLTVNTKAINVGFILERLILTLPSFNYNRRDCRSMFDPLDYVIFEGLAENGIVDHITFIDVKTGNARLTPGQEQIKKTILNKNVKFRTYE